MQRQGSVSTHRGHLFAIPPFPLRTRTNHGLATWSEYNNIWCNWCMLGEHKMYNKLLTKGSWYLHLLLPDKEAPDNMQWLHNYVSSWQLWITGIWCWWNIWSVHLLGPTLGIRSSDLELLSTVYSLLFSNWLFVNCRGDQLFLACVLVLSQCK